MEKTTLGYQWGDEKQFIGSYPIHHHEEIEADAIHMPPNTTLIAPPDLVEGWKAFWNGEGWDVLEMAKKEEAVAVHPYKPEEPVDG